MKKYYNDSKETYICQGVDTLKLKKLGGETIIVSGGEVQILGMESGVYKVFGFRDQRIVFEDEFQVLQGITDAPEDYDFKSKNEIALEAITAFLQGTANSQQRRVKVGDKEIEYSSFDELIKWKNYFTKEVRKQQKKAVTPKFEKLILRGF